MVYLINCPSVLAVAIAECGSLALGVSNELHDAGAHGRVGNTSLREHECTHPFARRSAGPVGSLGFDNVCAVDIARLYREDERFC